MLRHQNDVFLNVVVVRVRIVRWADNITLGSTISSPSLNLRLPHRMNKPLVTRKYLRHIYGPERRITNVLNPGLSMRKIEGSASDILGSLDLLLATEASLNSGSMDGRGRELREVIYAVHTSTDKLPPLRAAALVVFFEGTLDAWKRFITEFEPGGAIDTTPLEERPWVDEDKNNDDPSILRVDSRRALNTPPHRWKRKYLQGSTEAQQTEASRSCQAR